MPKVEAIINFSGYTAVDLWPAAETIHTKMAENADVFPAPTVSMAAFAAQVTDFKAKLTAKASRATGDTIAFNQSRAQLGVLPLESHRHSFTVSDNVAFFRVDAN